MSDSFDFNSEVISLDNVPEAYKPLYQPAEDGSKFVLDPNLSKKLNVDPLKKALTSERAMREQFEKKAKVYEKLESLGIDPNDIENVIASKGGKSKTND